MEPLEGSTRSGCVMEGFRRLRDAKGPLSALRRSCGSYPSTGAWVSPNYARNELGSPYGGRTALLRGVRQEYF